MASRFFADFGSCPICMRWAFRSAVATWILAAVIARVEAPRLLLVVAVVALGMSLLWLGHIVAYGLKIALAFKQPAMSWLETSLLFIRSLGVGVALSAVPRQISADRIYRYFGFVA